MMKTPLAIVAILSSFTLADARPTLMPFPGFEYTGPEAEADRRFEEALELYLGTSRFLVPDLGWGDLCQVKFETIAIAAAQGPQVFHSAAFDAGLGGLCLEEFQAAALDAGLGEFYRAPVLPIKPAEKNIVSLIVDPTSSPEVRK